MNPVCWLVWRKPVHLPTSPRPSPPASSQASAGAWSCVSRVREPKSTRSGYGRAASTSSTCAEHVHSSNEPGSDPLVNSVELTAIVPSLRVDVLGARAFKVSRSYFAKGVAAGRVTVGSRTADKATTVESGDVVVAHGLGSFTVVSVDGVTRKGNAKVTLSVTKSA